MRVLTFDVGNTTAEFCIFEGEKVLHLGKFPVSHIPPIEAKFDVAVGISVRPSVNSSISKLLGDEVRFLESEDIPVKVNYETPDTLGVDRLLFAYGVREFYTENAVLVSSGTALVVDLLLGGVFMGGFITAGLSLKLQCLSTRAEALPPLEPRALNITLGKSTRECLLGGTYLESRNFIEETAKRWSAEFGKRLPVFISGGDGHLFKDMGKYEPLILHRAMYRIIING